MTGVELATAYVSIVTESSKVAPEVKKSFGVVGKEADRAGAEGGKRFGKSFGGAAKGLIGAAVGVAAVSKAAEFFRGTVDGASDLNETVSKSRVIFGQGSKAIEKWGATADRALGLSKQQAIEAAASFGDMFSQIGFGRNRARKMSQDVVKLAADLGSFNNLDTAEVTDMISAAFRGEYDSLQRVIPNINAARVQTEALARTGKKNAKELTAQEKAAATLAIVQKDGARAAGDFARTSDGLANSQKIQAAEAANLKAQIGRGLLPIQLKVTRFMADKAIPAVSKLATEFENGTGAGGEIRDVLRDLVGIGKGVVKFFDALPGPVKKFGAEGAIALAVYSKFAPMLSGLSLNLLSTEKRMISMRGAAKNLAGTGGLVLLANGLRSADQDTRTFQTTIGGLATGFALGGPIGGAVGALGGFATSMLAGSDATKSGKIQLGYYGAALDGVTGKLKKNALEQIKATAAKDSPNLFPAASALGLSEDQIAKYIAGNRKVQAEVNRTLELAAKTGNMPLIPVTLEDGAKGAVDALSILRQSLLGTIQETGNGTRAVKGMTATFAEQRAAIRASAKQIAVMKDAVAGLPRRVQTKFTNSVSGELSAKEIRAIGRRAGKTPEQIKTLLKMEGVLDDKKAKSGWTDLLSNLRGQASKKAPKVTPKLDPSLAKTGFASLVSGLQTYANANPVQVRTVGGVPGRARGGPVRKGEPYVVGERRPELFVPSENGRIIPQVPKAVATAGYAAARSTVSLDGVAVVMHLNGQRVEGVFEQIADSRVYAASAMRGETERAFE